MGNIDTKNGNETGAATDGGQTNGGDAGAVGVTSETLAEHISDTTKQTADSGATTGAALKDVGAQVLDVIQSAQQEFDAAVARKQDLWSRISGNALYELTDEWKEIQQLDARMNVLWNNGQSGVVRKEDK